MSDIFILVNSNDPYITVPPTSMNVTLATHSFTRKCVAAESADNLLFLVNGTYVIEGLDGFSQGVLITNGNTKTRILTVIVSLNITNTNISCQAFNFISDLDQDTSEPALILVQGALDPPIFTNTSPINNTSIYISWTPPPTLLGTVINGYYVTSTTGDSVYTEDDNVTLSITNPDPCGINISIIAYNGINGTAAEVDNVILPSIPNRVVPVLAVILDQSQEVQIKFRVNVSELCPGEYPESILINITNSTGSSVFSDTLDLVPSSQSNYMYMDSTSTISLSADQKYSIIVTCTLMNVLGNFKSCDILFTATPSSIVKLPSTTSIGQPSHGSNGFTNGQLIAAICVPTALFMIAIIILIFVVVVCYWYQNRRSTDNSTTCINNGGVQVDGGSDEKSVEVRQKTTNFQSPTITGPLPMTPLNQVENVDRQKDKTEDKKDEDEPCKDEVDEEEDNNDKSHSETVPLLIPTSTKKSMFQKFASVLNGLVVKTDKKSEMLPCDSHFMKDQQDDVGLAQNRPIKTLNAELCHT